VTGGNSAGSGGGIKVEGPGIAHVRNCVITDNQAAGFGGGLYWESNSGDIWIVNCIFANNQAANGGGFAASSTPHFPDVTNSTFFNNSATVSGGGVWCNQGGPGRNLIFWGNTAPSNPQVSNLDVAYSIIQGSGGAGTGNIDADPMFINAPGGDFRIPLASPAVDAGTNSVTLPPTDIDGNPRVVYGTVDMGAFENVEIASGIDDEPIDLVPKVTQLRALYPNPFNPTVTIAFDLDRARHVSIEVYDVKGRRIATVLDETRPAGRYDVRWDAESRGRHLASGVYFVVIRSEGWRTERKIVLLK
jgi:hypothetical protein